MPLSFEGAWNLVEKDTNNPTNLYTKKSRDLYIDKRNGKEYIKGEYKIFKSKEPDLIEDTQYYEFKIIVGDKCIDSDSYLKEILAMKVFK